MDGGLLLIRLVFGLGIAAHGGQKLFGWHQGPGLRGTTGFLESLGFRPGRRYALLNGLAEFGGGILLALGLFGPLGPGLIVAVMVVATLTVHLQHGFFNQRQGYELPLLYATAAAAVALIGPGRLSFDWALKLTSLWGSDLALIAIALGILGGVGAAYLGRQAPMPHPRTR
jgi:putative oxidoreductase